MRSIFSSKEPPNRNSWLRACHLHTTRSDLKVNTDFKLRGLQLLIDHLIDEEIIPEDDVDQTSANVTDENTLELRRLEIQDREKERECQLKLKELEIREKELAMQVRLKELEAPKSSKSSGEPQFDISK